MEPIYTQEFHLGDTSCDRYGRIKPSVLLSWIQEVSGTHAALLGVDYDTLATKNLFWAILRTRVLISRMPRSGGTYRLETWPMATTRVAYPRSVIAYDEAGQEVFRSISIWVMMDRDSRAMVIPARSGFLLEGTTRGGELAVPGSLIPRETANRTSRTVRFTDLDVNGHMNNTRYLDWIWDVLPSEYHADHELKEFTICYLSEAREAQTLDMGWEIDKASTMHMETRRRDETGAEHRVFAAKILFT